MTKTLVDTNIVVYAHHKKDGERHAISAKIISELIDDNELTLSIQNLVEFARVLGEKAFPSLDKDIIRQYVFDLAESSQVIDYNSHTVMDALTTSKQYKIHFFDALLIATMQENGIDHIITVNTQDFKKIPWLAVRNPFIE